MKIMSHQFGEAYLGRRWAGLFIVLFMVPRLILRSESPVDGSPTAELEAAAREGDIRAAEALGEEYLSQLKFAAARNWFERAAKNGLPYAQWRLGEILKNGTPAIEGISAAVTADPTNALRSFFRAARQGFPQALVELGRFYESGLAVPPDLVEGYKWYALAVEHGAEQAADLQDAVASQLTPEQRTEAEARIAKFRAGRQTIPSGLPEIPVVEQINLRGITGRKEKRLALINNETFREGEERALSINDRPIKVKCLEIRDQSVVLRLEGIVERKEFTLAR